MSYYGLPFSKPIVVDLKPTGNYEEWAGKTEFAYPGVQNGGNTPNTLSAEISIETHGNSRCEQWNEYLLHLDVLGYSFGSLGQSTSLTLKDGLQATALDLKLNCTLE